jgi:hypothetical protein
MPEAFVARQRLRVEQDLDAAFDDITAWSLPLAFNVEVWRSSGEEAEAALASATPADGPGDASGPAATGVPGAAGVGWLIDPSGVASYRAAARLQAAGVRFRVALGAGSFGDRSHPAGTLFVPRLGNPATAGELVASLATADGATVTAADTSYSTAGISLGSSRMADVGPVRLGIVGGEGVRTTSFGSLWYLLDRQVAARPTRLDLADLGDLELDDFDVLVLPDGDGHARGLGEEGAMALERWLRGGGLLVAVGGAIEFLRQRELTAVEEWAADGDPEIAAPEGEQGPPGGARALHERPLEVPGAVLATEVRPDHPLAIGLPSSPAALFTGTHPLLPTGDLRTDVLTVSVRDPVLAGFAWPESLPRLEGALLVATEPLDRGRVVLFAQDPAFRGFWRGTFPLFLNAVLFGPALFAGGGY